MQTSDSLPSDFELSEEFKTVFEAIENTDRLIYLTGEAGTGKTTFLKYFRKHTKKKHIVLAPTGIAAIHSSGQTIHSFFGFPPKLIQPEHVRFLKNRQKLFMALELLIIDEASMMRADILDGIDWALRRNRERPFLPFGGVQVVLIGDMHQLPPVIERELAAHYPRVYETPYFFSAKIFGAVLFKRFKLTKIYRQQDPLFTGLLNKIRTRTASREDLDLLNTRVRNNEEDFGDCITLTPTNALAAAINQERLEKLHSHTLEYPALIRGEFDEKSYPTETMLRLKVGAQVLMIKNDPEKRWVNGTLAEVTGLKPDKVQVRIGNETHDVLPAAWSKIQYNFDEDSGRISESITGSFEQLPLKLAWAITIHKSQGLTFDRVRVDFGDGAFASGQAYVALSRCRAFETLYLKRPVTFRDIRLDARIQRFDEEDLEFSIETEEISE